jgi:hypothetical protein
MPASIVAVIYSADAKIIRRVITADTDAEIEAAAVMVDGEARLDLPAQDYGTIASGNLQAAVAAIIGPPTNHGRVVEVDASGNVVAAYAADPDIDTPIRDSGNTLELHLSASVGDVKVIAADAVAASVAVRKGIQVQAPEAIFLKPSEAALAKAAINTGTLAVSDGALVSTDDAVTVDSVLGRPVAAIDPLAHGGAG